MLASFIIIIISILVVILFIIGLIKHFNKLKEVDSDWEELQQKSDLELSIIFMSTNNEGMHSDRFRRLCHIMAFRFAKRFEELKYEKEKIA